MAAGTLPNPGTEYGPCDHPCEHADCDEMRRMVARACRFCGASIGYEVRFYQDPEGMGDALVHASCLEDSIEKSRKA